MTWKFLDTENVGRNQNVSWKPVSAVSSECLSATCLPFPWEHCIWQLETEIREGDYEKWIFTMIKVSHILWKSF